MGQALVKVKLKNGEAIESEVNRRPDAPSKDLTVDGLRKALLPTCAPYKLNCHLLLAVNFTTIP